jgi:hypothetical protein
MPAKPTLIVYAKSLTGHWKRCGVAWRNKTRGVSKSSGDRAGYLKVQLDFMPPGGELTIWNAEDRPNDLEPDETDEEPFDSRQDLMPTIVEEAG